MYTLPPDLIEVLTKRSGGRDVMDLTLTQALAEYEVAMKSASKAKKPVVEGIYSSGGTLMPCPVASICFRCEKVIPEKDAALYIHGKGMCHPQCKVQVSKSSV